MPANFVLLEKITVGAAGASSVTFSSIPQTGYTDLVIKVSARGTQASASHALSLRFNGSTTSYSSRELVGDGSAVSSASRGVFGSAMYIGNMDGNSATSNTFSNTEIYIPNYTSSNYKSISVDAVSENNATEAYATLLAGLWSNTAAITSIDLVPFASHGTLMPNSTFYLYGVAKLGTTPAIVPYATGGDTIMTDGTYWYHAFKSSGTFTPAKGLSCDVLVIAGGGGGGYNKGGGGGAGGVAYQTARSLSVTGYTVTIGGGGSSDNNGSNSVFDTITANGGGKGATDGARNGGTGGSGGGASRDGIIGSANQGSSGGATGYGFNGGLGYNGSPFTGGGGGGAGAVGGNGSGSAPYTGVGGNGLNTWSTWASVTGTGVSGYFAGGGGGGGYDSGLTTGPAAGGLGGGGAGAIGASTQTTSPVAGVANTGSGGGGGANVADGANGGSGLVIVRYAV